MVLHGFAMLLCNMRDMKTLAAGPPRGSRARGVATATESDRQDSELA